MQYHCSFDIITLYNTRGRKMIFYKVSHKCTVNNRLERKEVGIYSSEINATNAVELLKTKDGFKETADGFKIKRVLKFFKPLFLDKTFWADGFDTYRFNRKSNELCRDEEPTLIKYFGFLLTEYNFKFDKLDLGNMVDENGRLLFYGPDNCYYFYNDKFCLNFLNLVQKQDWSVYITKEVFSDRITIEKGKALPNDLCYNFPLLASEIKDELLNHSSIFGFDIKDV